MKRIESRKKPLNQLGRAWNGGSLLLNFLGRTGRGCWKKMKMKKMKKKRM